MSSSSTRGGILEERGVVETGASLCALTISYRRALSGG
jgi:hypothetical protein